VLRRKPRVDLVVAPGYRYALPGGLLDPERSARIFSFLRDAGLVLRRRLHRPLPATFAELRAAHDDDYLERLHRPGALTPVVGFAIPDRAEQALIAVEREMTGGTLLATRLARASGGIAVNLGGGFHHAHRDRGRGFCILNDVAVAVRAQRAQGFRGRILVVDLDLHDGDGTRSIFAEDATVHTYSVHNQNWDDSPAVEATVLPLGPGVGDERLLATLAETLPALFDRFAPELVFYLRRRPGGRRRPRRLAAHRRRPLRARSRSDPPGAPPPAAAGRDPRWRLRRQELAVLRALSFVAPLRPAGRTADDRCPHPRPLPRPRAELLDRRAARTGR
jgi:hypothetical protein